MSFCSIHRLLCPTGMEVVLLDAGASIAGVRVADRHGVLADVALAPYCLGDPSCAGATLAPYAGRIGGGRLRIGRQVVQLTVNEGNNQLHGGSGALWRRLWRCQGRQEGADYQEISFCAEASDGQDGFPGNRRFTACYRLYHDQRLELTLTASTDKPTRVNLSNHAYFNLSGDCSHGVSDHLLELRAQQVYLNDAAFLPCGLVSPPPELDYVSARPVGSAQCGAQRAGARGLNHCYVLAACGDAPAATLTDPLSGRRLRLYTDQPCVTVYSGGFLPSPGCAIALEAQEHPESPFAPQTDPLLPEQVYRRHIVYCFDTADA